MFKWFQVVIIILGVVMIPSVFAGIQFNPISCWVLNSTGSSIDSNCDGIVDKANTVSESIYYNQSQVNSLLNTKLNVSDPSFKNKLNNTGDYYRGDLTIRDGYLYLNKSIGSFIYLDTEEVYYSGVVLRNRLGSIEQWFSGKDVLGNFVIRHAGLNDMVSITPSGIMTIYDGIGTIRANSLSSAGYDLTISSGTGYIGYGSSSTNTYNHEFTGTLFSDTGINAPVLYESGTAIDEIFATKSEVNNLNISSYAKKNSAETITGNWVFNPITNITFSSGSVQFYGPTFFRNNVTLVNQMITASQNNSGYIIKDLAGTVIGNWSDNNGVANFYTSGSLGIGKTPTQKLDVSGNISIALTNSYMIDGISVLRANNGSDTYLANTQVGQGAGTTTAYRQTVVGYNAGSNSNKTTQTAVGFSAGSSNTGNEQTALGTYAGGSNSGNDQTAIGYASGSSNTKNSVTSVGYYSGYQNTGLASTYIGHSSGQNNSGDYALGLGVQTLKNNNAGNVVAIGYQAGLNNRAPNMFILQQTNINAMPLIYGNFTSGNVGIGTVSPLAKLSVNGTANINGNLNITSGNIYVNESNNLLTMRPQLYAGRIGGTSTPTFVEYGAFAGYSLPESTPADNEDLYFREHIPGRRAEGSNFSLYMDFAVINAQVIGSNFSINFTYSNTNMTSGVLPSSFNTVYVTQPILTGRNASYSVYRLEFPVNGSTIKDGDLFGGHIWRTEGAGTDITGEIILLDAYITYRVDKVYKSG